ncbi:MAG: hypothetical protein AVO33_01165 [delta proteobacterium ML8_F1]|nr:MAG: hypothetical protein AVO33_01165 [delta proteobacterium ML8_F1]
MGLRVLKGKKGFTLVELVVVIAILGILASMAVPRFIGFTDRGRIAADQASLKTLNLATSGYRIKKELPSAADVFTGFDEDRERMEQLVASGFLEKVLEPQKPDAEFLWQVASQRWLYSLYEVAENGAFHYVFNTSETEDFLYNDWGGGGGGTWSVDEYGLHTTGANGSDLLFIGNNAGEYSLNTRFKLKTDSGTSGGMGIFFETVLDGDNQNKDTGYIVQFDRGYSEIVIRKRVNGSESSSQGAEIIERIGNKSTSSIVNESIPDHDDSWWEEEKNLSITVANSGNEGKKLIAITLDGQTLLTDYEIPLFCVRMYRNCVIVELSILR